MHPCKSGVFWPWTYRDTVIIAIFLPVAEPNPPVDLNITVEGLILVVFWSKPFSLEGEELSYIITITNKANGVQEEAVVNSTIYTFSINEPIRERDCEVYMFTVFSNNSYSKSSTGVSSYENIPTGTTCITGRELMIMIVEYLIQLFCTIHVTNEIQSHVTHNNTISWYAWMYGKAH